MLDYITRRPIQIGLYGEAALIVVATAQLPVVRAILEKAGIAHSLAEGNNPSLTEMVFGVAVIALANAGDANRVRMLLDAAP